MRPWKIVCITAAILLLGFLTLFPFLKNRGVATDLAPGYHVLEVELTEGRENVFRYSIPTTNVTQEASFETSFPTNVLWVLYERPLAHHYTLRWVFTNLQGQKIVSRATGRRWGGNAHMLPSVMIQAFPAPIPELKEILNRTILFEIEMTDEPAFGISIP